MPSPNMMIRMTAVGASRNFRFPHRQIVLSPTEKLMIGRTSKVEAKGCIAAENNGWIDSPVMSRSHAELSIDRDSKVISVQDVGSLHGTFMNGDTTPLERSMPYPVQNGDELRFGQPIVCGNETFKPTVMMFNYDASDFEHMSMPSRVFRPPPLLDDELYSGEETDHSESGDSNSEYSLPHEADITVSLPFIPVTTVLDDTEEAQSPQMPSTLAALPTTAEMLAKMASQLSPRSPRYSPERTEESIRLSDSEGEHDDGGLADSEEEMYYEGREDEEGRQCSHAVDSDEEVAFDHYDSPSDPDMDNLEKDMDKRSELNDTEEEHSSQGYEDFERRMDGLGPFALAKASSNWAEDVVSEEDNQGNSEPSGQPSSDPVSLAEAFSPIHANHMLPIPTTEETTPRQASSFKIPSLLNPARPASPSDAALVKPVDNPRPILEPKSRIALLSPEKQAFFRARKLNKLQFSGSEDKTPTPAAMLPADILDFGRVEGNADSAIACKKAAEVPLETSTPEECINPSLIESAPVEVAVSLQLLPLPAPEAVEKLTTSALLDSGHKFLSSPPPKPDWRDNRRKRVEDEVPLISAADFHQHKSLKRRAISQGPVSTGGATSGPLETEVSQDEPVPKRAATEAAKKSRMKGTAWANVVEKVSFVALGGVVVLGSLIYSAPDFA